MGARQLNIRSDEAAERAAALARRLGKTTTQVVEEALRIYEEGVSPRDERGLTVEGRRRFDAIMRLAQDTRKRIKPGADLDDSWMCDEHGLPK